MDEAEERISSTLGQQLLRERKVRAEGVFALAKELHGLRRTRFGGRGKVQIQIWLTAAAINIKRALKELTNMRPVAKGVRAALAKVPFLILTSLADAATEIATRIRSILFAYRPTSATGPVY